MRQQDKSAFLRVDATVPGVVDDAGEEIIVNDELKKRFLSLANEVNRLFKAILPDPSANEFAAIRSCLIVIAEKVRNFTAEVSIEDQHVYDSYQGEGISIYS